MLLLVTVGCADEPAPVLGVGHLYAARAIDGSWQLLPPPTCDTRFHVPIDKPYELAVIDYVTRDGVATNRASVWVHRGGPRDGVEWPVVGGCSPPSLASVRVTLLGAENALVYTHDQDGSKVTPASTQISSPLGTSDVVAIPYDASGGLGRYIIKRGFIVDQNGFTLDFTTESDALEQRALSIDGTVDRYEARVRMTTIRDTIATVWPEAPSTIVSPPVVSAIPENGLVETDRQHLEVSLYRTAADLQPNGYVEEDLRAVAGPITIAVPPSINDVLCELSSEPLALAASTALPWNEFLVSVTIPDGDLTSSGLTYTTTPAWPAPSLQLPDLASIPGWNAEWLGRVRWVGYPWGPPHCSFRICAQTAARTSCSWARQDATLAP